MRFMMCLTPHPCFHFIGEFIIITHIYYACSILFTGFKTWVDLVILDIVDFDMILDMTWLYLYHVVHNCHAKTVTREILVSKDYSGKECTSLSQLKSYNVFGLEKW